MTAVWLLAVLGGVAFVLVVWAAGQSADRRARVMREDPGEVAAQVPREAAPQASAGASPPRQTASPTSSPAPHTGSGSSSTGPSATTSPLPHVEISEVASVEAYAQHLLVLADRMLEQGKPGAEPVQALGYRLSGLADALGEDEESARLVLDVLEQSEGEVKGTYADLEIVAEGLQEGLYELSADLEVDDVAELAVEAFEVLRAAQERTWSEPTVNDRITEAFAALRERGILALECCGWSTNDGWAELCGVRDDTLPAGWGHGACFFHQQDVDRGVRGQGLMLTFGPLHAEQAEDDELAARIGREIVETLEAHQVPVVWSGTIAQKIEIPGFDWRRRRV